MRLQRKSLIGIVFIFAICLAFACTYSAFAQCDDGGVLCPGGSWCCETTELCENPEESSCYPTDGTTFCSPLYPVDCGDYCCPPATDPENCYLYIELGWCIQHVKCSPQFPITCREFVSYCCPSFLPFCHEDYALCCFTERNDFCFPCYSTMVLDNDQIKLDILREVRDTKLTRTALGRSLIGLYYEHTKEVSDILLAREDLLAMTTNVVNEIVEKAALISANERVIINQRFVESILEVTELINENASPELKMAIKKVKKEIKRGDIFKQLGITINE